MYSESLNRRQCIQPYRVSNVTSWQDKTWLIHIENIWIVFLLISPDHYTTKTWQMDYSVRILCERLVRSGSFEIWNFKIEHTLSTFYVTVSFLSLTWSIIIQNPNSKAVTQIFYVQYCQECAFPVTFDVHSQCVVYAVDQQQHSLVTQ